MDTCSICPRTARPAYADSYACSACLHRMRFVLAELQRELPGLQDALVPGGTGPRTGSRFGGRAHSPMPLNGQALDLLGPGWAERLPDPHGEQVAGAPLVPLLRSLADRLAGEFPHQFSTGFVVPYGGATAAVNRGGADAGAWCRWLYRYLPYAVQLPWVRELHHALDDALARVQAVTRTQPRTHPRDAPCPECGACALSRTDGHWEVVCEVCGAEMEPDAYDRYAAAVLSGLTLAMARDALHNSLQNQAS
jgi:hypothetical protein